ncbi:MAG: TldD/PmbA family protein [Deltaproteobacteria bacterium]|nr:TldD/PmbA family protein [Deltaproteobacteria bacterium]
MVRRWGAGAALVVMLAAAAPAVAAEADGWILDAMNRELERSRKELKLGDYDPAYFVAYTVRDSDRYYVSGKNGALFSSTRVPHRLAQVDVRVGDYEMDSSEDSEFSFSPNQKWIPNTLVPIEQSPESLRHVLWLMTDYKYKAALVSFMKVKAKRVNDPKTSRVGSMCRAEPVRLVEPPKALRFDLPAWEATVRKVSGVFLDYPDIFDSSVETSAVRLTRYYVNTEGSRISTTDLYYQFYVTAVARAEDGLLLQDTVTFYGRDASDMPSRDTILKQTREMADLLVRMRSARVIEPATVPVLMSPEATGVFFHETMGHRLEGQRQEDEEEGRTFKGHLGQQVLPAFIDIYDDPTESRSNGVALNGEYRVDDEGVAAKRAVLVEKGVLRGFLLSRRPVEGFSASNGHGRSDGFQRAVGRMANLVVRGAKPVPHARMKQLLLDEVRRQGKPFGLIIETIAGGATNTSTYGFQAYKGMPRVAWRVDAATGAEELVRGFEIVGTPLSSINKIVATSDRYGVFNGYCGAESGSVPVSTVAPDALFAEMELQRAEEGKERLPILPPPWR